MEVIKTTPTGAPVSLSQSSSFCSTFFAIDLGMLIAFVFGHSYLEPFTKSVSKVKGARVLPTKSSRGNNLPTVNPLKLG